ncbi:hypothetical protein [Candidatus Lokiarchaeum ossiferum]|uniref:hypothetical protein n=1 Tax=Candidatus Lokiarchaeum ossiferum TaxID=2951803 RepID=UPI00352F32A0
MKIGIIAEYLNPLNTKEYQFTDEATPYLEFFKSKGVNSYVIDCRRNQNSNHLIALDYKSKKEINVPFDEIDLFYFGVFGKEIESKNIAYGLSEQTEEFFNLIDYLRKNFPNSKFMNPVETIIQNASKEYLIHLSKLGVPVIPTSNIETLDQLIQLNNDKEIYIAKPLISERAKGILILDGKLSLKELEQYYLSYNHSTFEKHASTYQKIINSQRIIVQKFEYDFLKYGEKKIAIVDKEITLSRNNSMPPSEKVQIVDYYNGAILEKYDISIKEREIIEKIISVVNQEYPFYYMRLDLIGKDENLKVNEIELINPSFNIFSIPGHDFAKSVFSLEEQTKHIEKVYNSIVKKCQ